MEPGGLLPDSTTDFNTIKTDTKKAGTTSKGVHIRFSELFSYVMKPKRSIHFEFLTGISISTDLYFSMLYTHSNKVTARKHIDQSSGVETHTPSMV